ncbi:MAG TPA: amidohydrolase family protein [Povalibacter sp.]|nr:amidohydrolase family protein [Povalibacter sp.]
MRIDAHQHFWQFEPREYPWMNADMEVLRRDWMPGDLRPLLEQQRLDHCIAVQARAGEGETDFLLTLATQHPWIAGVVGWVDLRADDLERRLERWQESTTLVGFRHQLQDETNVSAFTADAAFRRGIRLLQRRQFTYDVLVYAHQLAAVTPFCAQSTQHWLVLDHLGKPAIRNLDHSTWRRDLQSLASMPHVLCKVSGLVTEALDAAGQLNIDHLRRYLDTALELFGPQRLMFGSDWPVCLLAAPYARVAALIDGWSAQLSPEERSAIWGGTAARAYSLH